MLYFQYLHVLLYAYKKQRPVTHCITGRCIVVSAPLKDLKNTRV